MTRGKIFTNLGFVVGGTSEEQLVEFEKISSELREFFAKDRAAVTRKQKKERKKWYKDAKSIRYGELK